MNVESVLRVVLISQFCIFSIIRIEYHLLTKRSGFKTLTEEGKWHSFFLCLFIGYEIITFFLYLFYPQLLSWATIFIPVWLRWIGVSLGILSLILFAWVHRSLGRNFSATLRIKERHSLVMNGPYQWIRHPMYTAFFLLHIATFLLTSNWFIGVTWLTGLTAIIVLRVRREESMMADRFGDAYRDYLRHTGRFVPPIRSNKTPAGIGNNPP
jgi:protein-S-isoprenylcysteine O-methyltransferase Ste14